MKKVTISIQDEVLARIEKLAQKTGETANLYIRRIATEHVFSLLGGCGNSCNEKNSNPKRDINK